MSVYGSSSPESDLQCFSPGSCDSETSSAGSKNYTTVNRNKRLKASARERRRRHVLNDALDSLRRKVSAVNQNPQKLSKIEVLRLAIDYISMLSYYLDSTSTPYYAADDSRTIPQQQLVFTQFSEMMPQNFGLVENFRKENQTPQVNPTNRGEYEVYLRGYGNI